MAPSEQAMTKLLFRDADDRDLTTADQVRYAAWVVITVITVVTALLALRTARRSGRAPAASRTSR